MREGIISWDFFSLTLHRLAVGLKQIFINCNLFKYLDYEGNRVLVFRNLALRKNAFLLFINFLLQILSLYCNIFSP